MNRILIAIVALLCSAAAAHAEPETTPGGENKKSVYVFPIREDIMPAAVRRTTRCLEEARRLDADYVVINMNTYGGLLDAADSIRTMVLDYPRPVLVLVDNQAASAGALIAIAADSIYMSSGASIGAATVVDGSGVPMPDKYQSFMRAMMRSTAESHGRRPDDTLRWRRDPLIAEAMVDDRIAIPGVTDSGRIVTLTADEAIRAGYCEGRAETVEEMLRTAGIEDYTLYEYKPSTTDRILDFLTNPVLQGLFIMLIVGGLYFELQTPGVGFPLAAAIAGAVLYFAPLYLEGLAAHWELALFAVGIILIILEIFVTPGFGVLGITGIIAVFAGLAFALIDTDLLRYIPTGEVSPGVVIVPLLTVTASLGTGLLLSVWLGSRFLRGRSTLRGKLVLGDDLKAREGYVSVSADRGLVGRHAAASTPLRPAGRVEIDGRRYDAAADNAAFIERGAQVVIVRDEGGILYCREEDGGRTE